MSKYRSAASGTRSKYCSRATSRTGRASCSSASSTTPRISHGVLRLAPGTPHSSAAGSATTVAFRTDSSTV